MVGADELNGGAEGRQFVCHRVECGARGAVAGVHDNPERGQAGRVNKAHNLFHICGTRPRSDILKVACGLYVGPGLAAREGLDDLEVARVFERAGARLHNFHAVVINRVV